MLFTKDQHMIQALAAKRPDQAFNIWVLPGRPRCDRAVANLILLTRFVKACP